MDSQDLSGKTLGQYQLQALLGVGGMGAVYRAYQTSLNRIVAIKVLPSALGANPDFAMRFRREAQTIAALQHPNIIPIHDYGTEGNTTYIVMPLLSGGTLADRLKAGVNFSLPTVVDLLKKLSAALDHAHFSGVVHRDLKPANIMFDAHDTPFLVDFGIAKILSGTDTLITQQGATVGTPPYMAPEQWRGEQLSPATDQYALAIVVYQVLTGQLPFTGDTTHAFMYQHLEKEPEMPHVVRRDLPKDISDVLLRALAKQPQARYPTMTAFAQDFERAASGLKPTRSIPTKSATITAPPPQRPIYQQPIAWISLIVLLGIIGVMFFLLLSNQNGNDDTETTATSESNVSVALSPSATDVPPTATPSPEPSSTPTLSPTDTPEPTVDTALLATETEVVRQTQVSMAVGATLTARASMAVTLGDSGLVTETHVAEITQTASAQANAATQTASAASPTPTRADQTPNFDSIGILGTRSAQQTGTASVISATEAVTDTPEPTTTEAPSLEPSLTPTEEPTLEPTATSTEEPTSTPTEEPTATLASTVTPTLVPSDEPTLTPTDVPTEEPTLTPTNEPTPTTAPPTPTATIARPTATATVPPADPLMAFTSDRDGNAEIYVVYQGDAGEQRLTDNPATDRSPSWSPDGNTIAFASDRDGEFYIYLMRSDGSSPHRLTDRAYPEANPVWSPDGEWIAYHSNVDDNWDIYKTNVVTGTTVRLTESGGDDLAPTWSPDGLYIMFMSYRDGDWELYMVDTETLGYRRMTSHVAEHMFPSWGPFGNLIAFMSDRDGNREIYLVLLELGANVTDARFSVIRRVTNDPEEDTTPQWSPNGIDIAFVTRRNGTQDIYLTNSAGSDIRQVTDNSANDYDPAWYPFQP
ncbi:MAG: PD40 domain-containing protein [Anaerolineales bacterium]|nr:PD40 domain-containing protein [Anaerolineales bacterium]